MNYDPRGFYYGNEWMSRAQMRVNAEYIYNYLSFPNWNGPETGRRPCPAWTINAISGFLGNLQTESNINPAIYESLNVDPSSGYGLVQWTPGSTFLNWAAVRNYENWSIPPQLWRLYWEEEQPDMDHGREWSVEVRPSKLGPYDPYNLPREVDFWTDTEHSAGWLAQAWLFNYERPASGWVSAEARYSNGEDWYNYLITLPPPHPVHGGSIWLYWKLRNLFRQKGVDFQ